jgi:ribosome modulation factor
MILALEQAWKRGFKAGEVFSKRCPYTQETPEASSWFEGWNHGSAKALGFPHQSLEERFLRLASPGARRRRRRKAGAVVAAPVEAATGSQHSLASR